MSAASNSLIDDRDGTPRFYDINALSNFVARPLKMLGFDPHDRLVDYLQRIDRRKLMLMRSDIGCRCLAAGYATSMTRG